MIIKAYLKKFMIAVREIDKESWGKLENDKDLWSSKRINQQRVKDLGSQEEGKTT